MRQKFLHCHHPIIPDLTLSRNGCLPCVVYYQPVYFVTAGPLCDCRVTVCSLGSDCDCVATWRPRSQHPPAGCASGCAKCKIYCGAYMAACARAP